MSLTEKAAIQTDVKITIPEKTKALFRAFVLKILCRHYKVATLSSAGSSAFATPLIDQASTISHRPRIFSTC